MDRCPQCGESDLDWLTLIEVGRIRYHISEVDGKTLILHHNEDVIDRTMVHCDKCQHEFELDEGWDIDYH